MTRSSKTSAKAGTARSTSSKTASSNRVDSTKGAEKTKTKKLTPPQPAKPEKSEVEKEAYAAVLAFSKEFKGKGNPDLWEDMGDHWCYTFRKLAPAVVAVTKSVVGRKSRYFLHVHTPSEIEVNTIITNFDYVYKGGEFLKLSFYLDNEEVCQLIKVFK